MAGEAVKAFVEALNELDSSMREIVLAECCAEDVTLDADGESIRGRDAIDERIAQALDVDPEVNVRLGRIRSGPSPAGERRDWGTWEVSRFGGRVSRERFEARLGPDGRIKRLTVVPANESSPGVFSRLASWGFSNPAAAAGVLGGGLYLGLRIPLGVFYGSLGLAPEDVGFGPQVLVPQSVLLLVILIVVATGVSVCGRLLGDAMVAPSVARRLKRRGANGASRTVNAVFAVATLVGILGVYVVAVFTVSGSLWALPAVFSGVVLAVLLGQVVALRVPAAREEARSLEGASGRPGRGRQRRAVISVVGAVALAVGYITIPGGIIWALGDADRVRSLGGKAGGLLIPWRAMPAKLRWAKDVEAVRLTNDCHVLRYLGNDGHYSAIYDNRLDKVFRIPIDDAVVSTSPDCPGPPPGPKLMVRSVVVGANGAFSVELPPLWDDFQGSAVVTVARSHPVKSQVFDARRGQAARARWVPSREVRSALAAHDPIAARLRVMFYDWKPFSSSMCVWLTHRLDDRSKGRPRC